MTTKTGFVQRRDSVQGERVHMEALQRQKQLLLSNVHCILSQCSRACAEIQDRHTFDLPEQPGSSAGAAGHGLQPRAEELCLHSRLQDKVGPHVQIELVLCSLF